MEQRVSSVIQPGIMKSDFTAPWWCRNRHLQTLYPALFRKPPAIDTETEQFELPDGDFIDLTWTTGNNKTDCPLVIVLHGLEGSVNSPYAAGLLKTIAKNNWQALLMHFRGCSGRHNRLNRSYHSGDTGDIHALINELKLRYPNRPIAAVGISLGGNVLLKYLGEQNDQSQLAAAMAISVPFDLADGARALGTGFAQLYQWHLISHIRNKMKDKFRNKPAPVDMDRIDQWRDFFSFDDNVTAPVHGFKGVDDYYSRSSSKQFLKQITTPTLILHSKDDPFMSENAIPKAAELSNSITLELTELGGHVGFVYGFSPFAPAYYIENRLELFMRTKLE